MSLRTILDEIEALYADETLEPLQRLNKLTLLLQKYEASCIGKGKSQNYVRDHMIPLFN